MLNPPAGENLEVPVVHADRHGDLENAVGHPQVAMNVGIDADQFGRVIETGEQRAPTHR